MKINANTHLTYCTNIHPGESWGEVMRSLEKYVVPLKADLGPDRPFGIGLRLSNQASIDLEETPGALAAFQKWLSSNDCYIFTMNGFPYGGFHFQRVKEQVHTPDWRTNERVDYTLRLFRLLSQLLPAGVNGGISTSPLTYKHWLQNAEEKEAAFQTGTWHLLQVVEALHGLYQQKGQLLHLDIEPEPDGLLEDTNETIDYFQHWLLPMGQEFFKGKIPQEEIEATILRHLALCYDVCHFAVAYEEPAEAFARFAEAGITIGKIQISAALKADLPPDPADRRPIESAFRALNESTYLHQVIARKNNGELVNFPDLPPALAAINDPAFAEWRTHFHVPLFVDDYGLLKSTRGEIAKVLDLHRRHPLSEHLEIETYTWEVLPEELQLDLKQSIQREMEWVLEGMMGDEPSFAQATAGGG